MGEGNRKEPQKSTSKAAVELVCKEAAFSLRPTDVALLSEESPCLRTSPSHRSILTNAPDLMARNGV